jgi:hypothetical protein
MKYTISTNCTKLYSDCIYARSELIPANTKITDINSKPGWLALVLPWKNHWNEHCVIGCSHSNEQIFIVGCSATCHVIAITPAVVVSQEVTNQVKTGLHSGLVSTVLLTFSYAIIFIISHKIKLLKVSQLFISSAWFS